ncbi:MAG TPA: ComEC/Rec2 family competence protein [Stellaceae bacterium]|nr:ComEC/Rec2 family competence protein [Stellaceae bacterium]
MADMAAAGGGFGRVSEPGRRFIAALSRRLVVEGERRLLWLPVFFGAGIGFYFALTREPPLWLGPAATVAFGIAAAVLRRRLGWGGAALALAVAAAGFSWIALRAAEVGGPIMQRRLGPVAITGRVVDIDARDRGWRLILAPDPLPRLDPDRQPLLLRLHIGPSSDPLVPGDRAGMKAMLYPVPGPVLPGGHDLQRDAYFAGIGGVGYSYGGARRLDRLPPTGWRERVRQLRARMTLRITAVLPGAAGGVAAALITGKRGDIPEAVADAFRNSGLAHLLVIAGLHLGLVAGFVFFTARTALALIPPVALRLPIKKIAAALALVALAFYLVVSGARVPTERAFVMNGIVFAAILLDRLKISMRICAIAAAAVLAVEPESLTGPSFQMSFGAVAALIAVYETFGTRLGKFFYRPTLAGRILGYCGAVVLTTLVATLGTDPFAIYHFHRLALYSPLANVVAVPLAAVWTMPLAVLTCLLMPFGLERFALVPMGWGIDLTIWVAEHVAALPGNVWATPRLPLLGLVSVAAGGLWLCLWRGSWRVWGVAAVALGLATLALTRPPDILITEGGRLLAVRAPDGDYLVSTGYGAKFARSILAEETGKRISDWPQRPDPVRDGLACAGALCRYGAQGRRVLILTGAVAPPFDCAGIDAIVARVRAGRACRAAVPVVDRSDTWRRGSVALWLDPAGVAIESANETRGERPWVPQPHPRRPATNRPAGAEGRTASSRGW